MNNRETNHELIAKLNGLIAVCKDAEKDYRGAGDEIGNPDLRTLFHMYAQQRAHFAAELFNEVLRHGGQPSETGHVMASIHRGVMHALAAMGHGGERPIVEACEKTERASMAEYEAVLKQDLPADVLAIVQEQYAELGHAHETVMGLVKAAELQSSR